MPESPLREMGTRASSALPATLRWDRQNCVPLEACMSKDAILVLLTPLVVPPESQRDAACDPFEPLGRQLAEKHLSVRHVPYTKQAGITGIHVAFIRKADVVVFVITGLPTNNEVSQLDLADLVGEACGSRPLIVVVCCEINDAEIERYHFPTVIRARGFSAPDLMAVSLILLGGNASPARSLLQGPNLQSTDISRTVQPWIRERDLVETHELWTSNVPPQFRLSQQAFGALLDRDGYSKHHVVRDPGGQLAAFCATYITFADSKGEQLIGSIAAMVVRTELRGRGIGRILYDEALSNLSKIRGVHCLQLGSTFPRLLYGIPVDHPDARWAEGRGWTMGQNSPGNGRIIADWLLHFNETPTLNLASAGLSFRRCEVTDARQVAEMVASESERKFGFGWYDQYARILDNSHIGDVLLGFEGSTLVATAITYTYTDGNPTAEDLPWAGLIGTDVGGITCICIKGQFESPSPPMLY
jgi:ribosomal protein S18 acetylase RimI-like enzyme